MRKIKKILLFLYTIIFFISCNKKDYNYPEGTVADSKITYYADFTFNGERYIAIPVGTPYTEPGVTATEKGADLVVTTSGTVDIATPGVYLLTYSAVNKDGFGATRERTVIVYETDDDAAANDFSGTYVRTSNGVSNTWTKIAPGVYVVVNPGGAAGATLTVIAINPSGLEISIPEQQGTDGNITSSTEETYTDSTPAQYSWKIVNPGYGPALRTFIKQ